MLNTAQVALARHHAYTLFGRLFLEGAIAELRPFLQQIPELTLEDLDEDETAVSHYQLFQLNIFPYEGIFLDNTGLLGGDVTSKVIAQYQQAGFQVDASASSPDHIGFELAFLAFLSGAEADAWEDGLEETAVRIQTIQRTFLQQHLLRWLFPLIHAIQQQNNPFYSALADLTASLVADHAEALDSTGTSPSPIPPPHILENEKTGLKDIAAYLMTPAYCGVFFTRDDISGLAKQLQLPRGFGDRTQMMSNLMKTAVQYALLPTLLQNLTDHLITHQKNYGNRIKQYPHLFPFIQPWQEKCQNTKHLAKEIAQRAAKKND